jgi:hypothetical protein
MSLERGDKFSMAALQALKAERDKAIAGVLHSTWYQQEPSRALLLQVSHYSEETRKRHIFKTLVHVP